MPQVRDARDILDVNALFNEKTEAEKNNAYACTIVSLVPINIHEEKPHLFPGVFDIEAAAKDDFSLLYVEESHHFIPDPFDEKRNYKQITPPHAMAKSVCDDYNTAHICTTATAGPGLFWLPGRLGKEEVKKRFGALLKAAKARQDEWFSNLVSLADADWQKNHNRMAVSDLQRVAAQHMGLQKDWVEFQIQENRVCPFCKATIAVDSIKCFNCKEIVDVEKYNEMTKGVVK